MKKLLLGSLALCAAVFMADAGNLAGKKIYLNPGHGGYEASKGTRIPGVFANGYRSDGSDATDRWNATIPFPNVCEEGCWESKHNLWRGLELRRLLEAAGAEVKMSRTENRPEDDRIVLEIGREASSWGADMFLSIHSNGSGVNHLLTLFRGADPRPGLPFDINDPDRPESEEMASIGWQHLHDNLLTCWQAKKDPAAPYAVADSAFYSSWTSGYHLGVLREMWCPGYLAEIAFHDYKPEAHRMLSRDYSNIIAYMLYTGICDYFEAPMPQTGIVAGAVKDGKRIFRNPLFAGYSLGDHDQYMPVNGAKVTLTGNGVNKTYTTDDYYNGIYYFPDMAPGTYTLTIEAEGYTTAVEEVVCEAAKTRGAIVMMDDPAYDPSASGGHPAAYASALTVKGVNEVSFLLNADATEVVLKLYKDDKEVKSFDLGARSKGLVEYTVPAEVADDAYTWTVTATSEEVTEPTSFDVDNPLLNIANARGIKFDTNQSSPGFGRGYVTSVEANGKKGERMGTGIYVLGADLSDVFGQGGNPFTGGVAWNGGSSPYRTTVAENGDVFISDWGDGNSGIYVMDPENPTAPFTALFAEGSRNSSGLVTIEGEAVHGSINDCVVVGDGADRVLYTLDEDYPGKAYVLRYDIGTLENPWSTAPSKVIGNNGGKLANANQSLSSDGRGGLWVSQYRYTEDTYPVAQHINAKGEYDFMTSGKTVFIGSGPVGCMAASSDGSLIAVGNASEIYVAKATYDADGKPTLKHAWTIGGLSARPFSAAFDAAGNFYVAYNDAGVGCWALPRENNSYTTTATKPLNMTSGINASEVSQLGISFDGTVVTASGQMVEVYSAAGVRVAGGYSVDTAALAPGVYVVRAGSESIKFVR